MFFNFHLIIMTKSYIFNRLFYLFSLLLRTAEKIQEKVRIKQEMNKKNPRKRNQKIPKSIDMWMLLCRRKNFQD